MEYESESLEKKLNKPDWKQWLPVYGIYQVIRDDQNGRPVIIANRTEKGVERADPLTFYGSAFYQAFSVMAATAGTVYGLSQLAEKLF